MIPKTIRQYHVFLASPGDVNRERQAVRDFFDRYNRNIAKAWGVQFEVVDWENYSTVGIGRPQELITHQTLERFKDSLIMVIGIMGQRFGSSSGKFESGTEEEFRWAMDFRKGHDFPEIKWFFKKIDQFVAPPSADAIVEAAEQWKRVSNFREELRALPMYFAEYPENGFKDVFENDLMRWLTDGERPWIKSVPPSDTASSTTSPDEEYYQTIKQEFQRLDIAGIDNDRAFEIPLSEIYVRLRVIFDEESSSGTDLSDTEAIDIQTALLRYPKLAIVGDPGSGKSTFLKYVALMLARSVLEGNAAIAIDKLCIQEPLPIPVFVSCWDLSDFCRRRKDVEISGMLDFLTERLNKFHFYLTVDDLASLLKTGNCALLFDGLDEVPTDSGRALISRLLEDLVKKFPDNRYVVTSRIRAYTGDTILKGDFARCDIQPFDANDRAEFLKNWTALLFKIQPEMVLTENTDAYREFHSLTEGIETNDRIRSLAINPLLLTVIAIVHWNRKRLPEQRVDLYDECVDVLLGQRKEAEQVQTTRNPFAFQPKVERLHKEERPWIRKRFAEIALKVLQGENKREEASKSDILKLLAPRFVDRGARTLEEGEIQAASFLDQQELRSGLLVSRREYSYRFVHLTFQEYLAAWNLSNQEFDKVVPIIQPHLREQRWFEPLQLLGGEWAKHSDEKLDTYLKWLLAHQGKSIMERAPVVALCANIVKDSSGIAELTPKTRETFRDAVESTLDAFKPKSGVPVVTQLEILEALGKLGAAVKSHLIDATKSGLNQVRGRAIEMLLPHLSDDELFGMRHVLDDRSKVPIKSFLSCLLGRDKQRIVLWLIQQEQFSQKATDAFTEMVKEFERKLKAADFATVVRHVFQRGSSYYEGHFASRQKLLEKLDDEVLLFKSITEDREYTVRKYSLTEIAKRHFGKAETRKVIQDVLNSDSHPSVRGTCIDLLTAEVVNNADNWAIVDGVMRDNLSAGIRKRALEFMVTRCRYEPKMLERLRETVRKAASLDTDDEVRLTALKLMVEHLTDEPQTWELVRDIIRNGREKYRLRLEALDCLVDGPKQDSETWELITECALHDADPLIRKRAFTAMLAHPKIVETAKRIFGLPYLWADFDPINCITPYMIRRHVSPNVNENMIRDYFELLAGKLQEIFGYNLRFESPQDDESRA